MIAAAVKAVVSSQFIYGLPIVKTQFNTKLSRQIDHQKARNGRPNKLERRNVIKSQVF